MNGTALDAPASVDRTIITCRGWPEAPKVGTVTSQVVTVGQLTGASIVPKVTVMVPSAEKSRDPVRTTFCPGPPADGETLVTVGAPGGRGFVVDG